MEIQLTAKQLKITPALREYVQQKMGKTQKYFDHIVWGQAFLFVEKRSHKAEMIVHAPGQTFRALATAADLYSAIDLASDKIDAQLKKHKERIKSRHKPKTSDTMSEAMPVRATSFAVSRQAVFPMTPEQAATDLDASELMFLVYLDKDTDMIHVLYRREDETLGIIQPVRKNKR
ncbi:MAG: ribosomal subunit interface protein [Elusimicrobia bacterium CG11_big_fil_rev_8_21_14_0_20_64_6]|nr:MAG: ribosomal subunit interface protein [Elusimicrobia bacterium CG11_big_fil_rev_8_21_14_0_20_64_6]